MLTSLRVSLGRGHAGVSLDVSREDGRTTGRRLGVFVLLLVAPIALLIASQAIGSLSGWFSLDRLLNAPGAPWVYLLTGATFGALLGLVVILVARLRMVATHRAGSRQLTVTLRLTKSEALGLGIAAGLLVLFVAHLVADGVACAMGARSAC